MSKKLSTKQVVTLLERLNKGWPDNLELYSNDGFLELIDRSRDPEPDIEKESEYGHPIYTHSMVPVDTSRIKNDGGARYTADNGDYDEEPITENIEWSA